MSESDSAKLAAAAWVREQMDQYGLTLDDLIEAGCFVKPAPAPAPVALVPAKASVTLYRNALGQSWDGTGEYPDWLQRAVNAGQSIDFYRVE